MNKYILLTILLAFSACRTAVVTPHNLTDKSFPQVRGQSLAKEQILLPDHYKGKATVFLVGYQQRAQFDIDRWILGLLQADIQVQIVELPTIAGMMPQMVQSFIDNGMRSGIPKEDWASVVTIYEDADKIINSIGNERPQSAHVVLVDQASKIVWSSNQGYSAGQILQLKELVEKLV